MLIAITATENSLQAEVDPRFGRAAYYMIIDTATDEVIAHNNQDGINAANGAGTGAAQTLSEYGVKVLYTGRVGPKAAVVLDTAGIPYYENCKGRVQDILEQIKIGQLPQTAPPAEQPQTHTATANTVTQKCSAALQPEKGYRLTGTGRGMGKGSGRGAGRGKGQGQGQGHGMGRGKGLGCQQN